MRARSALRRLLQQWQLCGPRTSAADAKAFLAGAASWANPRAHDAMWCKYANWSAALAPAWCGDGSHNAICSRFRTKDGGATTPRALEAAVVVTRTITAVIEVTFAAAPHLTGCLLAWAFTGPTRSPTVASTGHHSHAIPSEAATAAVSNPSPACGAAPHLGAALGAIRCSSEDRFTHTDTSLRRSVTAEHPPRHAAKCASSNAPNDCASSATMERTETS